MSNINFKGLFKRGAAFALAVGFLAGIAVYALPGMTFADALNPLTERTLLLSSSSPGMHYRDAAGNATYAPPGSGPNGKKTGETFSFKVSSTATIKGFTLQYCTTAAGDCTAPGDNANYCATAPATPCTNTQTTTSDLSLVYPSPAMVSSIPTPNADGSPLVAADDSEGNFAVIVNGVLDTGWTLTTENQEDSGAGETGHDNFFRLVKAGGAAATAGQVVKIVFYATDNNYITNPGSGAFFVKINTYNDETPADQLPTTNANIIDGGVTVANVMTDSIHLQTKVLETMAFSVGTTNPDFEDPTNGGALPAAGHGDCDPIDINDPLTLGLQAEEYSLRVDTAFDNHSYWRLSSNSSNGATVYYSGYTLSNTVGDEIDAIGTTPSMSHPGDEQFGLAYDDTAETPDTNGVNGAAGNLNTPAPLIVDGDYDAGDGAITLNGGAEFAFDTSSLSTPTVIATENTDVVECSTAKMRYVANIGAATPAGIYTAAVNYLAAPQY